MHICHSKQAKSSRQCITTRVILLAVAVVCSCAGTVAAMPTYETGALNFTTQNQSMWAAGDAFVAEDSTFVGLQWAETTKRIGGIIGDRTSSRVNTNPLWWAWKGCKETVNFLCGGEPSKGQIDVVTDTRTGAQVDLTSSGKFGLEFGYSVNSGSVDAEVEFSAAADVPNSAKRSGEFFSLNTSSALNAGTIMSQSPNASAYINAIAELNASASAKACLIFAGCTPTLKTDLVSFKEELELLSIDPNSLKVLPNALPGPAAGDPNVPLAEVKILNQSLTLAGAFDATLTPGFKLTTPQFTIADTTPPTPDVSFDLASVTAQFPIINTSGNKDGDLIKSGGRSDFISAKVDLDGVATLAGSPPLGFNADLVDTAGFKIGASFDVVDVDAGPDLGITQDFELEPTLMAKLTFNNPVRIANLPGTHTTWEGVWDELPEIAATVNGILTIEPEFWLDAMFTNLIGIDLGLSGTIDLLKFSVTASAGAVSLISTNPVSLNSLLGFGNTLFATDKLRFPIAELPFQLGGFERILGQAITINVPEPSTLLLLLAALGAAVSLRRRPTLFVSHCAE